MKKPTQTISRIITDQIILETKSGSIQISSDPQGRMRIGRYKQDASDQLIIDPITKSITASSLVINGTISAAQYVGISNAINNEAVDSLAASVSNAISSRDLSFDSRLSASELSLVGTISTETSLRSSSETSLIDKLSASELSLVRTISTETSLRSSSETSLVGRLSTSETSLVGRISTETSLRSSSETSLVGRISTSEISLVGRISTSEISLVGRISTETSLRSSSEISLVGRISTETSLRSSSETSLVGRISTSETSLVGRISTSETSLVGRISTSETSLVGRISTSETSLVGRISTETSLRSSSETSLVGRISTETSLRSSSEISLVGRISTSEISLVGRISTETSLRSSSETSLASRITSTEIIAGDASQKVSIVENKFDANGLLKVDNVPPDILNSELSFSQSSNGTITLFRGGALSQITANPLSTITFTNVQSIASTTNTLANTINDRFESDGKLKSINLSNDNNGFKFTTSNKFKIGIGLAQLDDGSGGTTQYDSETDLEIVTGSTGTPDIALVKAATGGLQTLGQLNFKGWNGAQITLTNPFTGTTIRDVARYSERCTIQARTDSSGGGTLRFLTATSSLYNFFGQSPTVPSTRMTILANGNVGIGTTAPSQRLDINGTMRLRTLVAGTNAGFGRASNGDITALTSDQRLKKDINTITGSLGLVSALRGVTYKWDDTRFSNFVIDDTEKEKIQVGLIAQEVEAVLPELVYNNGIEDLKAVRYPEMVAVLIEAVKELKQQNEEIQNSLLELKIKFSGSNTI
jgi:hypothetical protein